MSRRIDRCIRATLAAVLVVIALAGCASDPSSKQQALDWVLSMEAEKKRLDDSVFPQYVGGN